MFTFFLLFLGYKIISTKHIWKIRVLLKGAKGQSSAKKK